MHDIRAIREDSTAFTAGLKRRRHRGWRRPDAIPDRPHSRPGPAIARPDHPPARRAGPPQRGVQADWPGQSQERRSPSVSPDEPKSPASRTKSRTAKNSERRLQKKVVSIDLLAAIPNLPASDAPDGADENANIEVKARAFGKPPGMNTPKEHFDLGEKLGLMDFERAARVSGARFVYLKAGLAKLERAIGNFMLDLHTDHFGYTEVQPPLLARNESFFGTGQLPKFEEDQFWAVGGGQLLAYGEQEIEEFGLLEDGTAFERGRQICGSASIATPALASFQPPKFRSPIMSARKFSTISTCRCASPRGRPAFGPKPAPQARIPAE